MSYNVLAVANGGYTTRFNGRHAYVYIFRNLVYHIYVSAACRWEPLAASRMFQHFLALK
jgi:hypothetical protein